MGDFFDNLFANFMIYIGIPVFLIWGIDALTGSVGFGILVGLATLILFIYLAQKDKKTKKTSAKLEAEAQEQQKIRDQKLKQKQAIAIQDFYSEVVGNEKKLDILDVATVGNFAMAHNPLNDTLNIFNVATNSKETFLYQNIRAVELKIENRIDYETSSSASGTSTTSYLEATNPNLSTIVLGDQVGSFTTKGHATTQISSDSVGEMKADEIINSMDLIISFDYTQSIPFVLIPLLESPIKKNSTLYKNTHTIGMYWTNRIEQYIHKMKNEVEIIPNVTEASTEPDINEQLRKLKDLESDGIITSEEFALKKKQLLGI